MSELEREKKLFGYLDRGVELADMYLRFNYPEDYIKHMKLKRLIKDIDTYATGIKIKFFTGNHSTESEKSLVSEIWDFFKSESRQSDMSLFGVPDRFLETMETSHSKWKNSELTESESKICLEEFHSIFLSMLFFLKREHHVEY